MTTRFQAARDLATEARRSGFARESHILIKLAETVDWLIDQLEATEAEGRRALERDRAVDAGLLSITDQIQALHDKIQNSDSYRALRDRLEQSEAARVAAEQRASKAEADAERRRLERAQILNVKSTEGLTSSEWVLRTAKAEVERDAAVAKTEDILIQVRSLLGGLEHTPWCSRLLNDPKLKPECDCIVSRIQNILRGAGEEP